MTTEIWIIFAPFQKPRAWELHWKYPYAIPKEIGAPFPCIASVKVDWSTATAFKFFLTQKHSVHRHMHNMNNSLQFFRNRNATQKFCSIQIKLKIFTLLRYVAWTKLQVLVVKLHLFSIECCLVQWTLETEKQLPDLNSTTLKHVNHSSTNFVQFQICLSRASFKVICWLETWYDFIHVIW